MYRLATLRLRYLITVFSLTLATLLGLSLSDRYIQRLFLSVITLSLVQVDVGTSQYIFFLKSSHSHCLDTQS